MNGAGPSREDRVERGAGVGAAGLWPDYAAQRSASDEIDGDQKPRSANGRRRETGETQTDGSRDKGGDRRREAGDSETWLRMGTDNSERRS